MLHRNQYGKEILFCYVTQSSIIIAYLNMLVTLATFLRYTNHPLMHNSFPFEVHSVISQIPSQVQLNLYDDERMQLPNEQKKDIVVDLPIIHEPSDIEQFVRKLSRVTQEPVWYRYFIFLCDSVEYNHILSEYACYLSSISKVHKPSTYAEAIQNPNWVSAMDMEIKALEDNHTWDIVVLPPKNQVNGCKWVYKAKYSSYGTSEKYKARLMAKGSLRTKGLITLKHFPM